jgi:hypothetical protein
MCCPGKSTLQIASATSPFVASAYRPGQGPTRSLLSAKNQSWLRTASPGTVRGDWNSRSASTGKTDERSLAKIGGRNDPSITEAESEELRSLVDGLPLLDVAATVGYTRLTPMHLSPVSLMSICKPRPRSLKRAPGWLSLLRKHGPDYLAWLGQNQVLAAKFDFLARALLQLFERSIQTAEQAHEVWTAAPAVLHRCNEQSTYEMPGAPLAYAWLHLLDRYGRTWMALERLVSSGYLPIAKFGVRTLDVGTGPGPSAFAVHDFYTALTEFGAEAGIEALKQPPSITCVEFDLGTNHLRHHLSEIMSVLSRSDRPPRLTSGSELRDFGELKPREERRSHAKPSPLEGGAVLESRRGR